MVALPLTASWNSFQVMGHLEVKVRLPLEAGTVLGNISQVTRTEAKIHRG